MRIWVTEIGEPLPLEQNARLLRYGQFTSRWVRDGHEVTWWASGFSHAERRHVRKQNTRERVNGVDMRLFAGPGYTQSVSLARVRHQTHFARQFANAIRDEAPCDLILTPIPTLGVADVAVTYAQRHGIPVVVDIRDEWPEEFVRLAPKVLQPVARLALIRQFQQVRSICRRSDAIFAVVQRLLNYGLRHANREQGSLDTVVPFAYETRSFSQAELAEAHHYWKALGVRREAFVTCFFGTIGRFFRMDTVLEAARSLKTRGDFQFVLCGEGSQVEQLREQARGIEGVFFPGHISAARIATLMEISKVGLAPYREECVDWFPNKPVEYLAGGLVLVSSIKGEMERFLSQNECGLSYAPRSVTELVDRLVQLHTDTALTLRMGRKSREVFERRFSAEQVAAYFLNRLVKVREARLARHSPGTRGQAFLSPGPVETV